MKRAGGTAKSKAPVKTGARTTTASSKKKKSAAPKPGKKATPRPSRKKTAPKKRAISRPAPKRPPAKPAALPKRAPVAPSGTVLLAGLTRSAHAKRAESPKLRVTEIRRFRKLFENARQSMLFSDRVVREDFVPSTDDRLDELDQATTDMEQSMRMRLRSREVLYLRKVEEALQRIEDGVFGDCDECGEPIERRRLEARPTATLCIGCKEEQERRESLTAAGLRFKSLGESFSRQTG